MKYPATLPAEDLEKLLELACRAGGISDAPTLMLFSQIRLVVEQAKATSIAVPDRAR